MTVSAVQTPRPDIHLCLVSEEAAPNLTPLLDQNTRPKEVILLFAGDTRHYADWLEQVIKQASGVKVSRWMLQSRWRIEHIQDKVLELLVRYEGQSIALNATCGTRPMSMAAYEAFRAFEKPIFYVHPRHDQLVWMYPRGLERHQLADRIKMTNFVIAYGGQVLEKGNRSVPRAYRAFAQELIANIRHYSHALGALNWFANTAEKDLRSKPIERWHLESRPFVELLERIRDLDLAQAHGKQLIFRDEEARFFANGGWLEQYVYATVNSLKKQIPAIQDSVQGLVVERGEQVRNEIDVAFLADNKLHVIECKAKKFKKGNSKTGAETLYKLDTVADMIGGMQARAMLVSYRPLREVDLRRAREMGIEVLQEKELQNLRSHLETWILNYI
ncbi:MAG: Card1-like endonuclease domain-containing protein [Thiolinea sp.]